MPFLASVLLCVDRSRVVVPSCVDWFRDLGVNPLTLASLLQPGNARRVIEILGEDTGSTLPWIEFAYRALVPHLEGTDVGNAPVFKLIDVDVLLKVSTAYHLPSLHPPACARLCRPDVSVVTFRLTSFRVPLVVAVVK